MISYINKIEHEKFCSYLKETIQKLDQVKIQTEEKTLQTFNELKVNKKELEKCYLNYLKKTDELRKILDNYQNCRHNSGLNLRRVQSWFKFTYPKLSNSFLKNQ
jgi:hypothetical protein